MKENESFKIAPPSEASYWDAAVQAENVQEAECPRLISLIEAISMPIINGDFDFSAHLLEPLSHELSRGHIDSKQAYVMYLRIMEINKNNLKEIDSLRDGVSDSSLDRFKEGLINSFCAYAKYFQAALSKYSASKNPVEKQPFCLDVLTNRVFGRQKL